MLGSGAPLRANLDGDLTYRVLMAGYMVLHVPDAVVLHHGFRTWQQGRTLMYGAGIGVGATYMKHVRLGEPAAVPRFLIEWLRCITWQRLLTLRPRAGLGCFLGYGMGGVRSFRYPIDHQMRVYVAPRAPQAARIVRSAQPLSAPVTHHRGPQTPLLAFQQHIPRQLTAAAIGILASLLLLLGILVPGISTGSLTHGQRVSKIWPGNRVSSLPRGDAPHSPHWPAQNSRNPRFAAHPEL